MQAFPGDADESSVRGEQANEAHARLHQALVGERGDQKRGWTDATPGVPLGGRGPMPKEAQSEGAFRPDRGKAGASRADFPPRRHRAGGSLTDLADLQLTVANDHNVPGHDPPWDLHQIAV